MNIRVRDPQYIVRLVHLPQERLYAFHFEFDERTNNPQYPISNFFKNVIIGYDRENSEFTISKEPLDSSMGVRVIFQFSGNISYRDVPFLKIWVDPEYEFVTYTYTELYHVCEREGALGNVFLGALMSAHGGPGKGERSSRQVLGWALDILSRHTQILPAGELDRASEMLL